MIALGDEIISRPNKTIYVSKNGKYLVKVFNSKLVGKADVLSEAMIQARVEEKDGILIPEVVEVFKHGEDWAIAQEYIDGETLEEKIMKDKAGFKTYIDDMLALQIKTQAISVEKLPSLTMKLQDRISAAKEIIPATVRYELHMRLDSMPKHNKLCHCDFVPSNVIVTEKGKEYITDWAHAARGNASADAAYTYLNFQMKGQKETAEYYLSQFCKLTDTAIQYVQQWMPIVAAAMAYKAAGKERQFLLSQIDVVESL